MSDLGSELICDLRKDSFLYEPGDWLGCGMRFQREPSGLSEINPVIVKEGWGMGGICGVD
jgi:hypothetical protein